MSYKVETIPPFDRIAKRLQKKYRHIKDDLKSLARILSANPFSGVAIPGFAHQVWKIRLASSDIQAGKRSGYRVIYAVREDVKACYLLYIYPKPMKKDVSASEVEGLLLELESYLGEG
ncbi:addiction module toxin RelE [Patescibacteria group bacterium]|nr:addiction module toxin RelE [Patescibacteria group bacterium]